MQLPSRALSLQGVRLSLPSRFLGPSGGTDGLGARGRPPFLRRIGLGQGVRGDVQEPHLLLQADRWLLGL